jgi:ATP-dependent RNA helicase DeaD
LIHSLDRRKLQAIERRVKQSLNVCQIPTRSQVEAAHVDKIQAKVQEALSGERVASFLPIIAKMAEEYDIHTVAAAALQLVYDQTRPAWLDMEEPQNRGGGDYDRGDRGDRNDRGDRGGYKSRGGGGGGERRGGSGATGKPVLREGSSAGGGGGRYDRRDSAPRNESSRYERDSRGGSAGGGRGGYRSEERV